MTTIFGPNGARSSTDAGATPVVYREPRRRRMLALAALAALAVPAVGIVAGRTVVGAASPDRNAAPVARRMVSPPEMPRAAPAADVVADPQPSTLVAADAGSAMERAGGTVAPRSPLRLSSLEAPAASALPSAAVENRTTGPANVVPSVPPPDVGERSAAGSPGADCDLDSNDCLAARLDMADRRVARALDRAAAAGVRPRDLRGYTGEWNRARREADARPLDALHIYGMIESDLYTLADRAADRDDRAWR